MGGVGYVHSRSELVSVKFSMRLGALQAIDIAMDRTPAASRKTSEIAQKAIKRLDTMFSSLLEVYYCDGWA